MAAARPLRTDGIRQFIADQLDALGTTSNAITIASTLRAYLRHRATCGDAVPPMLGVIASPAHGSMASLPRALKSEEVDRLLGWFTSARPSPRRGYAVVRLALDLGLRSIEISRLQLTDVGREYAHSSVHEPARPLRSVMHFSLRDGRHLELRARPILLSDWEPGCNVCSEKPCGD